MATTVGLDRLLSRQPSPEKDYEFLVRKYKGGPEVRSPMSVSVFHKSYRCWCFVIMYLKEVSSSLNNLKRISIRKSNQNWHLLIEVVKNRKLQIILESHSEHLLIRLMRRIAEEEISADDTAFYFCQMNEGTSEIERLNVDHYGNITNWPQNFFGDEMGDLAAKAKAEMKRRKADKL